jgi:hypothetical protein
MAEHRGTSGISQRVRARWVVVALCIALSIPTTAVQLFGRSAGQSDYGVHLAAVERLQHGHLEVSHFLFHGSVAVLGFVLTNPIATLLIIALGQVVLGLAVFRVLCDAFEAGSRTSERAARLALVTTAALLISGPINLLTFRHLYLGYVTTTTYHSPTVQLLKPLALILFLRLHGNVLAEPPEPDTSPRLLNLAILSIVTTLAKPSFTIVVLPALMVMVLVYRRTVPVRRTLATLAVLGASVGAVIVWQLLFLFTGAGGEEGVGIRPLAVALAFAPTPRMLVAKLLLSVAFPAIAFFFNRRAALADRRLVFSYICFLISLLYYLLLAELGPRLYHGNFLWGAMVSLLVVFVSTCAMLARREPTARRATRAPWLILALHAACGLVWLAASNGLLGHLCDDGYGNWCW